ncbi:type II toxin-antitoxin system PemK/MazF family toxin [Spirosoma koreense]
MAALLISTRKSYPTRVNCQFEGSESQITPDQARSVDKVRLMKQIEQLDDAVCHQVCARLVALFTY